MPYPKSAPRDDLAARLAQLGHPATAAWAEAHLSAGDTLVASLDVLLDALVARTSDPNGSAMVNLTVLAGALAPLEPLMKMAELHYLAAASLRWADIEEYRP